jgi:O-antigen ligase
LAFKRWIKALGDLVIVLIVLTDPDPCAAITRVFSRVSFLLMPLSILFIRYYPELGRAYDVWDGMQRFIGVANDKNMLGMTCLVFGLVSAWRIIEDFRNGERSRRTRSLIVHGAVFAMAFWLLRMANSMTSLSWFLLATGMMAATSLRAAVQKPWVVHLVVAVTLFITTSVMLLGLGGGLLHTLGRDPTLTGRTTLWTQLLEVNQSPLLGPGFESFWLGPRLEKIWSTIGPANEAHNGYLEVFLNLGWIGVALLAFVIAIGYRNVVGAFRRDPEAGRLGLAYFVVGTGYSFTEAGFRTYNPVWIAFLLAIVWSAAAFTATGGASKSAALVRTGEDTFSSNKG